MSTISGPCPEKERLAREYQMATADYLRTVLVLAERAGIMSKADYTKIRDFSEAAA